MRVSGPPDGAAAGLPDGAAAQLALGIERGLAPQVEFADDGAAGVAITRSSSWWNFLRCGTCAHTFRRGDRVLVDPMRRTVQHLVPGLACGSVPDAGADAASAQQTGEVGRDRDAFAAGLLATWESAMPLTRIGPSDWRLPLPGSGRRAPTCLYCGHTYRPGEYVVTCPCQTALGQRPACGAAVHRDPAAGLPCWENWQPGGALSVCPITSAHL